MQPISIEKVYKRFQDHITVNGNSNIVFTGKFGIGKTFFLRKFFETNDDYNAIFISPVNYVVSSNENIFEIIKVDIIRQLFENGYIDYSIDIQYDKFTALLKYAQGKPLDLMKNITSALSKISVETEMLAATTRGIGALVNDFSKFERKLNKGIELPAKKLKKFSTQFSSGIGTYLEDNIITQLIRESLLEMKEEGKESVLIIDDLDRLDPDHIFRILNIFSAHNSEDGKNKFGFDKIVIVCDIESIEKIYKHKYGADEFEGYIDKFYSIEYFKFSNRDAIINYVENRIDIQLSKSGKALLIELIVLFENNGLLNLRKLFKHVHFDKIVFDPFVICKISLDDVGLGRYASIDRIDSAIFRMDPSKLFYITSNSVELFSVIKCLSVLFGDFNKMKKHVRVFYENRNDIPMKQELAMNIIEPLIIFDKIRTADAKNKSAFVGPRDPLEFPSGQYAGLKYTIMPRWNGQSRYNGSEDYYCGARLAIDNPRDAKMSHYLMIAEIHNAITYLENSGRLALLNIYA